MADPTPPEVPVPADFLRDLLRWSETLAAIARTGMGFTQSLYERERYEEVLKVAADIKASADLVVIDAPCTGRAYPATSHPKSRSARSSATTRAVSCWSSGLTPACGCTRPVGPTSATRRPRWR